MTSKEKVLIYTLRESGMHFFDIAKKVGGTAKEIASVYLEVASRRKDYNEREKVVYRKRMKVKK